jgi:hypothetical protein
MMKAALLLFMLSRMRLLDGFQSLLTRHVHAGGSRMRATALTDYMMESQQSQILTFIEPTTGTRVALVGAMHYNPMSIALASSTCEKYVESEQLHSVIVESCPTRWEKTLTSQPTGSFKRKLFNNEMQAAADVATRNNLPVVLGDQDIAATNKRMGQTFKQSVVDLFTPWNGGWTSLYNDISEAGKLALPTGDQYLGTKSFFNVGLLLAAPVSLVRYPLSFMVKSPAVGIPAVVGLVYALLNSGDSQFVGTTVVERVQEVLTSATIFGVESAVLARVFLVALLAERNEILAASILAECRKAAGTAAVKVKPSPGAGQFWAMLSGGNSNSGSGNSDSAKQGTQNGAEKVVVAVLGAAHVNGIRLLLEQQPKAVV